MKQKPKGKVCGAKLRGKNAHCQKPPMANGRCRLHGGKTPSGPDSPHFKHGQFAYAFRSRMAERFTQIQQGGNPLDMVPELNVQRTMLDEYIAQATGRRKVRLTDLMNAADMAKEVVKSAATIAQTRQKQAMTLAEIKFFQKSILLLMERYVPDPNQRRNFIAEIIALIPRTDDTEADEPARIPASAAETG